MSKEPISAAEAIAQIENQAAPARAWSYVVTLANTRYLSNQTWGTRREVICALEDDYGRPWRQVRAMGYEVVKVRIYEGG